MKYRNMLPFVALSVLILTSCDDNKMEWYKDPTHGAVTSSELPLQLAEKISRYKPLKEYLSDPNFKLGIGVGMDEYLGDETTTTIVNENFNDLTIGYAMKHGPMVDSKGNLKFDKVDQLFTKTTEAGISIYGHCLHRKLFRDRRAVICWICQALKMEPLMAGIVKMEVMRCPLWKGKD